MEKSCLGVDLKARKWQLKRQLLQLPQRRLSSPPSPPPPPSDISCTAASPATNVSSYKLLFEMYVCSQYAASLHLTLSFDFHKLLLSPFFTACPSSSSSSSSAAAVSLPRPGLLSAAAAGSRRGPTCGQSCQTPAGSCLQTIFPDSPFFLHQATRFRERMLDKQFSATGF